MSLADYAHWNEDAEYMWWHEEGKHSEEPRYDDADDYIDRDLDAEDAFAESLGEYTNDALIDLYEDEEYLARWPKAKPLIEWELAYRRIIPAAPEA